MAEKKKKKKDKDRNKQDDIKNYWQKKMGPLRVRDYKWRVFVYRGEVKNRKNRWLRIDPMVTGLSWEDQLVQTVNITMVNANLKGGINIREGHKVVVAYTGNRDGKKWKRLFTLRINSVTTSAADKTMEIEASDELDWLKKSKDDFSYRKGKGKSKDKRPKGWLAHQIARDVAKRYGIKVGTLAKGTAPINKLVEKKASPLSIIEKAYEKEREETGFKFVIRMKNGRLNVTRLRRSRELLVYGGAALDAQISRRIGEQVATALTVKGTVEEGGEKKKKTVKVQATKKIRGRFGYIHDFWTLEDEVGSMKKLKKQARKEMAERQEPDREVSLTVPGYPGLQRGDAIRVALKDAGLVDLVYVTGASHSVSAGQYTTDLTLSFDEFYMDEEGEKIREKKCKKAKEKGRKRPKYCRENYDPFAPAKKKSRKGKNKGDGRSTKPKRAVRAGRR